MVDLQVVPSSRQAAELSSDWCAPESLRSPSRQPVILLILTDLGDYFKILQGNVNKTQLNVEKSKFLRGLGGIVNSFLENLKFLPKNDTKLGTLTRLLDLLGPTWAAQRT